MAWLIDGELLDDLEDFLVILVDTQSNEYWKDRATMLLQRIRDERESKQAHLS